jgi:succinate dehydrogenase / fumarate reductase iron-sulfur subunit
VRINGKPDLACHTHLDKAKRHAHDGVIEVEPMGNMPVIKDLIVDMEAVHWKKIRRVTPWLIAKQPVPEREYIVPRETMVDVTQSMACIQCGACVSDCLAMEVDPDFVGPAALAKAYRFVGDPRDDQHFERLKDLAEDPRLRRRAIHDHGIEDRNNGERHEEAFATLVRKYGLLNEVEIIPRSHAGNSSLAKFKPAAAKELASSLPSIAKALLRRKVTPAAVLKPHKLAKRDLKQIERIYEEVESHPERVELNLYITGYDED